MAEPKLGGPDDLTRLALKACLIARDAAFNVRDLLTNSSRMAFLAIKDCEKELDLIERQIDERLPAAITRVNEARARQLLSTLKSTTDLERIGDLVMSVAMRVQARTSKMAAADVRQLVEMSSVLRDMLDLVHQGFSTLDLECARKVLQMDKEIDRVCHGLFQKHHQKPSGAPRAMEPRRRHGDRSRVRRAPLVGPAPAQPDRALTQSPALVSQRHRRHLDSIPRRIAAPVCVS